MYDILGAAVIYGLLVLFAVFFTGFLVSFLLGYFLLNFLFFKKLIIKNILLIGLMLSVLFSVTLLLLNSINPTFASIWFLFFLFFIAFIFMKFYEKSRFFIFLIIFGSVGGIIAINLQRFFINTTNREAYKKVTAHETKTKASNKIISATVTGSNNIKIDFQLAEAGSYDIFLNIYGTPIKNDKYEYDNLLFIIPFRNKQLSQGLVSLEFNTEEADKRFTVSQDVNLLKLTSMFLQLKIEPNDKPYVTETSNGARIINSIAFSSPRVYCSYTDFICIYTDLFTKE